MLAGGEDVHAAGRLKSRKRNSPCTKQIEEGSALFSVATQSCTNASLESPHSKIMQSSDKPKVKLIKSFAESEYSNQTLNARVENRPRFSFSS